MYKKLCSMLLLICMLFNLFLGTDIYALDSDKDISASNTQVIEIDKTEAKLGDTVTFTVYSSDSANMNQTFEVYFLDKDGNSITSEKLWSPINKIYYSDTVYTWGDIDSTGKGTAEFIIPTDINTGEYGFNVYFYGTDESIPTNVKLQIISSGVNKSALEAAIKAAITNKTSVVVSSDGSDIETTTKWVIQEKMTSYETTIAEAQGIFNKVEAEQTEVNQAVTDLGTATEAFNNAKKDGTKQVIYTVTFSSGINGTLMAAVDDVAISTGDSVIKGKNIVFTATPAENYEVKEWIVNGNIVSGNNTNTMTVSSIQASKVVAVTFEQILDNIAYPVGRQTVVDALNKATSKLIERFDDSSFNYQKHWMAIAINGFDKKVPDSYLNAIIAGDMPASNSGQYGKYILGICAAGGDPTNVNGRNLLAELCKLSDMKNVDTEGGIYTTPFGLLALDTIDYQIPSDAGFTRDDIINKLITLANPAGGEDGVGFVLTALGKYYDKKPEVKAAVDKVVSAWANKQGEDGGFGAGAWSPNNNVNTAAQVLMGLSFNGKDPQSEQFTKAKGNLISFILSLQNQDGTFNWQKADHGSISMATEQAVYALAQYLRQLDGKNSIYDFTGQNPQAPDTTAPEITTNLIDKIVNSSVLSFTASANDAIDGAITPIVKIGDKTVSKKDNTYTVVLNEGINTIKISAKDNSENTNEKTITITYNPIVNHIPSGDKPKIEIPKDNNDYKIPITSEESNKEILIQIPSDNNTKVIIGLTTNNSLPQIEVVKGNIKAVILKGTQVISGDTTSLELITSKDAADTTIKDKVNDAISKDKKLDAVTQVISMGSSTSVEFNDFITLIFTGMHDKEAAYIGEDGKLNIIQKYASDAEGLVSGKKEYAYSSGNDLIVKTKHFTDFVTYAASAIKVPGDEGAAGKYITLYVDKLTINEGYVISSTQVELQTGDTAWTILKRELDKRGISCKYIWTPAYDSIYVQAIDGDGEFDHGSGSGWMYNVNGIYPNYGASKYILEPGDKLEWRYTTDLGADLGEDLSKWETPNGSISGEQGVNNKTYTIDVPKDIKKDYTVDITKEQKNNESITINIPDTKLKVILNLEEVKQDIPNIAADKGNISVLIDKGTKIKNGNSKIELITPIDTNDTKIQNLIKDSIGNKDKYDKIVNAFMMGDTNGRVLFDKPITLMIKGGKGQYVGFIEENKFTPIEIFDTEEKGAKATKDSEIKTYAFIKNNDLYIKTNHFTTFVSYNLSKAEIPSNVVLEKLYKDTASISSWAYTAIGKASEKGFVSGNNNNFCPKANITRAEFVKMIVNALQMDIITNKVIAFKDVTDKDWFYPYVNTAYKAGIISGYNNEFCPNQNITREQMAAIIMKALAIKPVKPIMAIKDIDKVSAWAKQSIETITAYELMLGHNNYFNSKAFASREMAVVVVMRTYEFKNNEAAKELGVKKYIEKTGALMQKTITNPVVASVGGEWTVLSLARSDIKVPETYYTKYYANVEKKLKETSGKLHNIKYTEYDRIILALTSIGKDVNNVAGYDITKPLGDFNTIIKQGLNGPIWALLALDSKNYKIPIDENVQFQTTRDMLVDYILAKEISGGGWSLTSEAPADTDITAMAIQALSKYQDNEKVKAAINQALNYLSTAQQKDGSFKSSWSSEPTSESIAQVIVALTSLDINLKTDTRFIKNGKDLITALLEFYVEDGGFRHVASGEIDAMATDQGMYALVAFDRYINGQKHLYDMTDV